MQINPGTRLGRYEVRSVLGAGGMGEVYLAHDTRLERTVALKILPQDVAADQNRMQRFIQEAKAASALNHPNIITIYEVERTDSTHFIATEFIDGETLRQHMTRARMTVQEALDVAIQAASALATAHEAGIVHRDIKPDNIMLRRRDQIVKVLDFGLAKLTERQSSTVDMEAATRAMVNTAPGMVMGTASYMSPEQARGLEVDARTDIWSLGVTLYEMVAGRVPFTGETVTDAIASILKTEPQPLSRFASNVPARLEEVVAKTLEKDREERYQTIKDLLVDLRRIKKRLDFESELERSHPPDSSDQVEAISGAHATTITDSPGAADTRPESKSRQTTSAEYLVTEIKRHPKSIALTVAALIIMAAGALALVWYKWPGRHQAPAPVPKMTRLISGLSGYAGNVSISADGRYVAYTINDAQKMSLWVRQVSQDTSIQIVPPQEVTGSNGTAFSPDGELIYFVLYSKTNTQGALYQVPVLGGKEPKKILEHINSPISLSPDGKQFAFIRSYLQTGETALMTARVDGSSEPKKLGSRNGENWFDSGVAWSPDGQKIASIFSTTTGGLASTVVEIPAEGGAAREIMKWRGWIPRLLWLGDGSGLIMSAAEKHGGLLKIWHISYPDGASRKLTNDLNEYGSTSLGVTADSTSIVTILSEWSSQLWLAAPNEDESRARRVTNGKEDGRRSLAFMPDGRIVYTARVGENNDLWMMNADGSNSKALTSDAFPEANPAVSSDGRYIVFQSNRPDDVPHIWRMDADGSNLKQISTTEDHAPAISPDGRWVVFHSWATGKQIVWKIPIDGGQAVQVSDRVLSDPVFSPDGKLLSCMLYDESISPPRWRTALVSFEDGQIVKTIDLPLTVWRPLWSVDGRALLYADKPDSIGNIWSQPIEGGAPKQLTRFTSKFIDNFDISRDGKRFLLTRSTGANDIVLIKDFK